MRIISGSCRGRKLITPKDNAIRPTSDRVRESLFNIIGGAIKEARVLDLFAGTGALGIESLSRGAASAHFLDQSGAACRIIQENIALCQVKKKARVTLWDLSRASLPPTLSGETFDLIFMDPPYNRGFLEQILKKRDILNCLDPGGTIVIEHTPNETIPEPLNGVRLYDQRRYGKTVISFLEK